MIFTTNCPEDLDPAIVRSERVDKMVRLGLVSRGQIRSIFSRIYSSESILKTVLETKAQVFAGKVRDRTFSPASIQGFLLQHQSTPDDAITAVEDWQDEQLTSVRSADNCSVVMSDEGTQEEEIKQSSKAMEYASSTEEIICGGTIGCFRI